MSVAPTFSWLETTRRRRTPPSSSSHAALSLYYVPARRLCGARMLSCLLSRLSVRLKQTSYLHFFGFDFSGLEVFFPHKKLQLRSGPPVQSFFLPSASFEMWRDEEKTSLGEQKPNSPIPLTLFAAAPNAGASRCPPSPPLALLSGASGCSLVCLVVVCCA